MILSVDDGDGISRKATSSIKRQFYGMEMDVEKKDKWDEFREKWQYPMLNFGIFFFYYFIGGLFYWNVEYRDGEGWSRLDCLYFETVTMTTVGYGDFAPTTDESKVFTIFYIIFGIAIVGRSVNNFAEYIVQYAEKKAKYRDEKRRRLIQRAKKKGDELPAHLLIEKKTVHATEWRHYQGKIVTAFGSIFLIILIGAIFFTSNEPDIGWIEAFYFVVVTTSTVGYGDTKLTYDSSRAFAVFYILCSVVLVTLAIGNLAGVRLQIAAERKKAVMLSRKLDFNFIRELDTGETGMDKTTFLVAMLVQQELVNKEKDVDPWLKKFEELDKAQVGILDFDDAIADLEREQRERAEEMQRLEEEERQREQNAHAHDMLGNLHIGNIFSPSPYSHSEHGHSEDQSETSDAERFSEFSYSTSDNENRASVGLSAGDAADGSEGGDTYEDDEDGDDLRGLSFSYTDNPLHPAHKHYYDTQYGDADTETDAVAESGLAVDNL